MRPITFVSKNLLFLTISIKINENLGFVYLTVPMKIGKNRGIVFLTISMKIGENLGFERVHTTENSFAPGMKTQH